jgi:CRP-like cAMP-binding protein
MKKKEESLPNTSVVQALKKSELFKEARGDVLEFLATYGNIIRFQKGDEVLKEGEEGDTMYIIIDGDYEVVRGGKSLALMSQGDFFGEVALISDKKRNASVICKSDGSVLEIDRMLFKMVLEKDWVLRDIVYKKFQERVVEELKGKGKVIQEEKMTLFENLKKLCGLS